MEFRRSIALANMWVPWTVALVLWLVFTVAVWDAADWIFRVLLCLLAVIAAAAAIYGRRTRYMEFVADHESIRWGSMPYNGALIGEVTKILHDETTGLLYLELAESAAKRLCAPGRNVERLSRGLSSVEFLAFMREQHPSVPIEAMRRRE